MTIAQALRTSRQSKGLKQAELPDLGIPYGESMIGMIERGERGIARDISPVIAEKLDHPSMFAELARELTGFGPPWLNGPNVDLHRASVREKSLEELHEAIQAMLQVHASTPPSAETESDRRKRYEHLMQCMDAMVAMFNYIGVQCLEYNFSMLQLSQDHFKKLKGKRYVEA